jgi:MFS family permease
MNASPGGGCSPEGRSASPGHSPPKRMKRPLIDPALLVILAGVCAALHVGKLPPALPALRDALGVTLLQAGFLLSMVQLAGMTLGLAVGLTADGFGLRRSMLLGLGTLAVASAVGGWARSANDLLLLRALEGFGLLLAALPAPSLIRQLVPMARLSAMLGLWGAYMPLGSAMGLLCGPLVLAWVGWQGWWWGLAALTAAMAVWLARGVPPDSARHGPTVRAPTPVSPWPRRLHQTLTARGPWLVALELCDVLQPVAGGHRISAFDLPAGRYRWRRGRPADRAGRRGQHHRQRGLRAVAAAGPAAADAAVCRVCHHDDGRADGVCPGREPAFAALRRRAAVFQPAAGWSAP